jgi:serine/threonine protein phosphatase PrpC
LKKEKKRIYEMGGRIERFIEENGDEVGPYRVWLKNEDYPGLAMSRSIGDLIATTVGVIPDPEVIEYELNENSLYMIMCSDGVWEFLSNRDVMEISKKYYMLNDFRKMNKKIVKESIEKWKNEDVVIDDITVLSVCFRLNEE